MTAAIRKLVNSPSKTIVSAAFLVGVGGLLSRLLGLLRTRLLASRFGAGDVTDAYLAAFRIPDFLYAILIMGSISAAFIPVFTQYWLKDKKEAWGLANSVLNLVIGALAVIGFLGFVLAPLIMPIIAPGFHGEKLKMAITMCRIMFLSPILLGISNIFSGILQGLNRFLVYSLAPSFYNLGIIFGIIVLVPVMGVNGLAWGVVLGAMLHWLVQLPAVIMNGWHWQSFFNWRDQGVRKILSLMGPRALGQAATQINLVAITAIASLLTSGSLTVFNWANDIQWLPLGVFGIGFATAVFPRLARDFAKRNDHKFFQRLESVLSQVFFLTVPASIILIMERGQIVRLLYGTGKFDWVDTRLTAACLAIFCLSIFAQGLSLVLSRAFYARHDTKTPLVISLMTIAFNIFASLFFVYWLRHSPGLKFWLARSLSLEGLGSIEVIGLALAFTLSNLLNWILLLGVLASQQTDDFSEKLLKNSLKTIVASIVMTVAIFASLRLIAPLVNMHTGVGILIQASIAAIFGLVVYLLASHLAKSEPLTNFWQDVKSWLSGLGVKSR